VTRSQEPAHHWFEGLADHMGAAYLRYSFTKGTDQEVDALVEMLGLEPGDRVLDVGCGPGRHAHALGARGMEVVGVDVSQRFVDVARDGAPAGVTFERLDARMLPFDQEFDVAISLCQGAFGLIAGPAAEGSRSIDPDLDVLTGMARALRPGGRLAVSAFSSYFQVRYLEDSDAFDVAAGVNHERTVVRSEAGEDADVDLWTSCFTPRELRLLVASVPQLELRSLWSVTPGAYAPNPPDLEHPEFLLIADRPG
jgi:SAM-dependent methyltransferase